MGTESELLEKLEIGTSWENWIIKKNGVLTYENLLLLCTNANNAFEAS